MERIEPHRPVLLVSKVIPTRQLTKTPIRMAHIDQHNMHTQVVITPAEMVHKKGLSPARTRQYKQIAVLYPPELARRYIQINKNRLPCQPIPQPHAKRTR